MNILNAAGTGPYMEGDPMGEQAGRWFNTRRSSSLLANVTASVEVIVATGDFTGDLYLEFTADPARLDGISRVLIPHGTLHTNAYGVTVAADRQKILMTNMPGGSFSVALGVPGAGALRYVWHPISESMLAAATRMVVHVQGGEQR